MSATLPPCTAPTRPPGRRQRACLAGDLFIGSLFAAAVAWLAQTFGSAEHPLPSLAGSLLLASPFAILLLAQRRVALTWQHTLFFAVGSLPFIPAIATGSFAVAWMHAGWAGIMVVSALCGLVAAVYAGAVAGWIRRRQRRQPADAGPSSPPDEP